MKVRITLTLDDHEWEKQFPGTPFSEEKALSIYNDLFSDTLTGDYGFAFNIEKVEEVTS